MARDPSGSSSSDSSNSWCRSPALVSGESVLPPFLLSLKLFFCHRHERCQPTQGPRQGYLNDLGSGSCKAAGTLDISALLTNDPKPLQSPTGPSFQLACGPWPPWLAKQTYFGGLPPTVGSARALLMESINHFIPRATSISADYEPRRGSVEIVTLLTPWPTVQYSSNRD